MQCFLAASVWAWQCPRSPDTDCVHAEASTIRGFRSTGSRDPTGDFIPTGLLSVQISQFADFLGKKDLLSSRRYCFLNDVDYNVTQEAGFVRYAKQMRDSGYLPELCKPRQDLVDLLLFDAQMTAWIDASWVGNWPMDAQ